MDTTDATAPLESVVSRSMATPLLHREAELTVIDEVLLGRRNGVAFTGEPGVGRSVLLDAAEQRAEEVGSTVFRVYGTPSAATIEFGAVATLLPETHDLDRLSVLRDTERLLIRQVGERGGVILVDDAHDLDGASTALLHAIAASRRLRLVLTLSTDRRPTPTLARLWKDRLVDRREVMPLDRETTRAFLERTLGGSVADATERTIWELSAGHPSYVETIASSGTFERADGLLRIVGHPLDSATLRELLAPRLDALTDEHLTALASLAHGSPLDVDLLERVAGRDVTIDLERSGLIVNEDARLAARHPLLAHAALASLPTSHRRSIAVTMAEALLARPERSPADLVRAVCWLLDAGTVCEPAVLLESANEALALRDYEAASRIATAALACVPSADRWEAAFVLGRAERQLGHVEAADQAFRSASDAPTERDRVDVAVAHAESLAISAGRFGDGLAMLSELSSRTTDPALIRRLTIERTFLSSVIGDFREVATASVELLADPDLDDLTTVIAGNGLTFARVMLLQIESYDRDFDRLRAAAERVEQVHPLAVDQLDLISVVARLAQGRIEEALDACALRRTASDRRRGCGEGSWAAIETFVRSLRIDPGLEQIAQRAVVGLASADPMGLRYVGTGIAAIAMLQSGSRVDAHTMMSAASTPRSVADRRSGELIEARAYSWETALDGDLPRAAKTVADAGRRAVGSGHVLWGVLGLYDCVRFGRAVDVRDDLRRVLAELADGSVLLSALCRHADAAAAGDVTALAESADAFEEIGATLLAAEALCHAAAVSDASASPQEAHRLVARAQVLAGGQLPPTPPCLDVAPALTNRQVEIALRLLEGATAREVADELSLSTRTVENHIATIYQNLGVSSRDELASMLRPIERERAGVRLSSHRAGVE